MADNAFLFVLRLGPISHQGWLLLLTLGCKVYERVQTLEL
jgi:hypothetical protein